MSLRTLRFPSILVFLTLLVVPFSACSPTPTPTPTSVPSPLPTAQARLETLALPTNTITPTFTQAFTATWTVTPGPTNTLTPAAQFAQAQVISVTNPVGGFQVILRVPGLDKALDIVLESRKFTCQTDAAAPETLFCQGLSGPPIEQTISLVFVDPQSGNEIYQGTTYIIKAAVPTATPVGFYSCPQRGQDIFCEVECRIYGGNPCIVATCNDACGVYYSIHDCPQDIPNDGICAPDLELEMRIKYGLPH